MDTLREIDPPWYIWLIVIIGRLYLAWVGVVLSYAWWLYLVGP